MTASSTASASGCSRPALARGRRSAASPSHRSASRRTCAWWCSPMSLPTTSAPAYSSATSSSSPRTGRSACTSCRCNFSLLSNKIFPREGGRRKAEVREKLFKTKSFLLPASAFRLDFYGRIVQTESQKNPAAHRLISYSRRRATMRILAAGFALTFALMPAAAPGQAYPSKVIRMVVPFAPGGTSDIIGRTLGQKLSEAWMQPVVMDNRGGVAGSIGAAYAAKQPPDGYTPLVGNIGPVAINSSIYKTVGYDPIKDFTPITLAVTAPQLVVVHP